MKIKKGNDKKQNSVSATYKDRELNINAFIVEEVKETILDFSQETVKVL